MSKRRAAFVPTSTRRRRGAGRGLPAWRGALTLCLMLAAAAQGVIAQGHVHFRFERTAAVGAVVASAPATTDDNRAPGDRVRDDPSTCALCQVLASGAAPFVPTTPFSLPLAALRHAVPAEPEQPAFVGAVTHIWTSRGPPLA
jgi:hypothetical protein